MVKLVYNRSNNKYSYTRYKSCSPEATTFLIKEIINLFLLQRSALLFQANKVKSHRPENEIADEALLFYVGLLWSWQ